MRLGPYELVKELGRGAMGVVYRARHQPTGVERAVKVIELDKSDVDLVHRFDREAKSLARVDGHANIVRVHETGIEGRHAFYAMDLVEGRSLQVVFAEGPMKPRAACVLLAKVARAIAHCHAHGIIHRDLKPENVIIDKDGEPRLVDFGLVRDLLGSKLTYTGTFLGTPAYMSPEQIRGEPAQQASDVHALGLLLYEALAGTRPYQGKTVVEIAQAILGHKFVPVAQARPDVPVPLVRIVERALDPRVEARPTARDLARELEAVAKALAAKRTELVAAGKVRRYRRVAVGLGLVALGLGLAVGLVLWRSTAGRVDPAEQVQWLAAIARARLGQDDVSALLAADAAIALEEASGAARDPEVRETLARAAVARGADAFAVAATTSALALAPAKSGELLLLRARARLGLRDVDGALEDLRGVPPGAALELRARALLAGRRTSELLSLEGQDPFVQAARVLARFERDVEGAPEKRIKELADEAYRKLQQAPEVKAVASELRARAEVAAVVSVINVPAHVVPSQYAISTTILKDSDAVYRPLVTVAKELEQALGAPRYLDVTGDLDVLDAALAIVEAHPDRMRAKPDVQEPEDVRQDKRKSVEDLTKLLEGIAVRLAPRPRDALPHRVRAFLALLRLGDPEQSERRRFLRDHADEASGEIASYLRVALLYATQSEFVATRTTACDAAETFRKCLEHIDPTVRMTNGEMGFRAHFEVLAAEICIRASVEQPSAATAYLEEAARRTRLARELVVKGDQIVTSSIIVGRDVIRAETTLALVRNDLEAAKAAAAAFGGEEGGINDYAELVLRAEVRRRLGDLKGAERLLASVSSGSRIASATDDYTQWFLYDWAMEQQLVRYALGRPDALEQLEVLDKGRSTHPRLLPWIDAEVKKVLERP
ncbi:MAG TPA: serine/threonine-protein kinase [Planctomycetota bacterium]|nr:serine/threonine-protein kinase [Planctomycetota bacterium]